MALLEVENLTVQFYTEDGVVRAVDGLSYEIEAGETFAIVGESGAGKSVASLSLLDLVGRPGEIVDGEVRFRGRNVLELPARNSDGSVETTSRSSSRTPKRRSIRSTLSASRSWRRCAPTRSRPGARPASGRSPS